MPTRELGIPVAFLAHGTVAEIRADIGLTPQGISRRTVEFAAAVLGRGESGRPRGRLVRAAGIVGC